MRYSSLILFHFSAGQKSNSTKIPRMMTMQVITYMNICKHARKGNLILLVRIKELIDNLIPREM